MDAISLLLQKHGPKSPPPPHEKAASVNEIMAFLAHEKRTMSYGFWLSKVGKKSYGDVMAILKRAGELPAKYSKGGYVVNQLRGKIKTDV